MPVNQKRKEKALRRPKNALAGRAPAIDAPAVFATFNVHL